MMERLSRAFLASLALAFVLVATAGAAKDEPRFSQTSILVKFRTPGAVKETVARLGDRVLSTTLLGVTLVGLDRKDNVRRKVAQYRKLPVVVYAEPNFIGRATLAAPNDPAYGSQWAYSKLRAVEGWTVSPGSYSARDGVRIAIVDTGVEASHPELADGRVLTALGANCVNSKDTCDPGPATDDNGHGTHVAGIAAASTNNGVGVAGTGFSTSLIPVKVLSSSGYGTYAAIANGITWAVQHGAKAINLSLAGTAYSQTLCDAVANANALGALVVAAAGNDGSKTAHYPAACKGAVGVAATTSSDARASWSDYGNPNVFVSAPGDSIYSTYIGGSYTTMSGTSMATPFVAATAALLFGQSPTRTVADVKMVLATSSDKVGSGYVGDPYGTCPSCTWSPDFGYGRLNLYRALGAPDFGVTAAPAAATTPAGGSAAYTVSVSATGGFASAVALSVDGLPIGASASFAPASLTPPGTSELTVSTSPATLPGPYTLKITGTSDGTARSTTVTLVVGLPGLPPPVPPLPVPPLPPPPSTSPGDFTISAGGTRMVMAGVPASFTVTFAPVETYAAPIYLSASTLPPNTTAAFAPPVATAPGAAELVVATTLATPPGTYTITVVGTSGVFSHSATVTLIVKSAP